MTLNRYIERQGLTHEAFAAASGLPRSLITHYLRRTRKPGLNAALAIERATAGAVPVESWSRERRRKRRAA